MSSEGNSKRPTSVTSAGVILLLGSALKVLGLIGSFVLLSYRRQPVSIFGQQDEMWRAFLALPQLVIGAWGVATAIGVLRLRYWARVSILVLSLIGTHFFVGSVLAFLLLPSPVGAEDKWIIESSRGLALFYSGCGGITAMWAIQFSGKEMNQFFQHTSRIHI